MSLEDIFECLLQPCRNVNKEQPMIGRCIYSWTFTWTLDSIRSSLRASASLMNTSG